jgi:hypothetical protein
MATYGHTFTSGDTLTPPKLNDARTVTDIVDADISASAAIALSKLATGALPTAITVASANLVDGTVTVDELSQRSEPLEQHRLPPAAVRSTSATFAMHWATRITVMAEPSEHQRNERTHNSTGGFFGGYKTSGYIGTGTQSRAPTLAASAILPLALMRAPERPSPAQDQDVCFCLILGGIPGWPAGR